MKKIKKYLLIFGAALMMLTLTACGSTKIDLDPYISMNCNGCNGKATANIQFDYASFEHEIMSQWKEKEKTFEKLAELTALETTFQLEPETTEGVSNGDTITVMLTYNEEKAKELGYSFTNTKKTIQVEGLQDAIPVDPFDEAVFGPEKDIYLEVLGCSPYLTVSVNNSSTDIYRSISYNVDFGENKEDGYLKNGDTLKITASFNSACEEYELTRTELEVTIEGIESYVTDVSMLSQNSIQELKNRMLETLEKKKDSYFELFSDDSEESKYTIDEDFGVTFGDLMFTGSAAAVSDIDTVTWQRHWLVVPFQIAVDNVTYCTIDGVEHVMSFPDACGYFVVSAFRIDKNGDLITGYGNIELDNLFENQELMDQAIESKYGEVTYSSFN